MRGWTPSATHSNLNWNQTISIFSPSFFHSIFLYFIRHFYWIYPMGESSMRDDDDHHLVWWWQVCVGHTLPSGKQTNHYRSICLFICLPRSNTTPSPPPLPLTNKKEKKRKQNRIRPAPSQPFIVVMFCNHGWHVRVASIIDWCQNMMKQCFNVILNTTIENVFNIVWWVNCTIESRSRLKLDTSIDVDLMDDQSVLKKLIQHSSLIVLLCVNCHCLTCKSVT